MKWAQETSKSIFKKLKLSHWSDKSKVFLFGVVVYGTPVVILTYLLCYLIITIINMISDMLGLNNKPKKHHKKHGEKKHSHKKE
jgi:hypothetical protein